MATKKQMRAGIKGGKPLKRFLVTRRVEFSKVIEARNKTEALEEFGDADADTKLLKETAKRIR